MSERWLAINGHEGRYAVSDMGEVMSMNYAESGLPGILKQHIRRGYPSVFLYHAARKGKWFTVHALVASAFIGPRPEGMQINHRNGVKNDARESNLEYCSQSENMKHAFTTGLQSNRGERHSRAKLTDEIVKEILVRLSTGDKPGEIAKEFGVCAANISHIKRGRIWSHIASSEKAG